MWPICTRITGDEFNADSQASSMIINSKSLELWPRNLNFKSMLSDIYFKLEFKQTPPIQINDHTPTCYFSSCTVKSPDFPKQQHMYSFILPYYAHKIVSESLPTSKLLFLGLLEVKTDSSKIPLPKTNLLSKVHDRFAILLNLVGIPWRYSQNAVSKVSRLFFLCDYTAHLIWCKAYLFLLLFSLKVSFFIHTHTHTYLFILAVFFFNV